MGISVWKPSASDPPMKVPPSNWVPELLSLFTKMS